MQTEFHFYQHIPGFGKYLISDEGEIWNIKRCRWVRYKPRKDGYCGVCLVDDSGKRRHMYIHRLLALAFYGEAAMEGLEVDHIDRNRSNNCIWSNIQLVTHQQNLLNRDPWTWSEDKLKPTSLKFEG